MIMSAEQASASDNVNMELTRNCNFKDIQNPV